MLVGAGVVCSAVYTSVYTQGCRAVYTSAFSTLRK